MEQLLAQPLPAAYHQFGALSRNNTCVLNTWTELPKTWTIIMQDISIVPDSTQHSTTTTLPRWNGTWTEKTDQKKKENLRCAIHYTSAYEQMKLEQADWHHSWSIVLSIKCWTAVQRWQSNDGFLFPQILVVPISVYSLKKKNLLVEETFIILREQNVIQNV